MIETIERALGLQVDWRAHPELRERYKWLLEIEENVPEIKDVSKLEDEIEELEKKNSELEDVLKEVKDAVRWV